ncbi:MAG: protein kinase [Verrucomicrobiales bacterium]|nr:protein kinase [Verrucomicrobiales bacterium]
MPGLLLARYRVGQRVVPLKAVARNVSAGIGKGGTVNYRLFPSRDGKYRATSDHMALENTAAGGEDDGNRDAAEVNHCPACEGEIDITGLSPFTKIECPHCGQSVRVRTQLGNFMIRSMLGEGGMSQVFLAEDLALDRQVALKILHQDLSRDAGLMALFEREAKLTASINHPNVVKVYTVGSDGGYFFIAMELVDNVSLEARIAETGMMPEREALDLLHDVAAGLKTAYQGGLIHRDIKPGNILLTQAGTGKLVDFGLALQQGGEDHVEDLWATPFYVPPEKLDGKPDDFRGDIYSLGATFFHALAGRPPFQANTASMEELRAIKSQPVSLHHASAPVSAATVKLIDRMMAYKPEARFKTYDDLLAAIEDAQSKLPGGSASRARRQNVLAPARKGLGPLAWLGISGGGIAVIGLLVALIGGNRDREADLPDSLAGSGGDRVVAAGQQGIATRYTAARDLLLAGRITEARAAFQELLKEEGLKQPTRAWTELNVGLTSLLGGSTNGLTASPAPTGESAEPDDPAAAFVRRLAGLIQDPLPAMPETISQLAPNSAESIGLLALGLKNWNHGEPDAAMAFFDAFAAATPPADVAWMAAYRSLIEPYRADHALLKNLPKPVMTQSEAELEAMREPIRGVIAALKTAGGARDLAQRRLARIDSLLEAKKAQLAAATPASTPQPEPVPGAANPAMTAANSAASPTVVWTPEAEAERSRLAEAVAAVKETLAAYRFTEAGAAVSGFAATTGPVKELQIDVVAALGAAESFRVRLVERLGAGNYSGKLQRRAGLPLDVKVVSADAEKLVVDLMFGPNDLPWTDVSPAWMLNVAREDWLAGNPSETSVEDWVAAAWFLRFTGLTTEAAALTETIAPLAPDFAARWERLKPLP